MWRLIAIYEEFVGNFLVNLQYDESIEQYTQILNGELTFVDLYRVVQGGEELIERFLKEMESYN